MHGIEGELAWGYRSPETRDLPAILRGRIHYSLYFIDIGFIALSAILTYASLGIGGSLSGFVAYGLAAGIAITAFSFFAFKSGLYDWRRFRAHLRSPTAAFAALMFAFGSLLIIGFVFKLTGIFSRLWLGSWISSIAGYLLLSRLALSWYMAQPQQKHLMSRRAVILGAGETGREVLDHIQRFGDQSIEVVGFLDDRESRLAEHHSGPPLLGGTDRIEQLIRQEKIDLFILALPRAAFDRIGALIKRLSKWSVDIYLAPDKLGLAYGDRLVFRLSGMNLLSLQERPISEWSSVAKRVEDLCIAIPAVIILSPLLALVAIAIRLESKGPVLFVQERYGFHNELIRVYKFRSMYAEMTDRLCVQQTTKDDPRITKVGRFIRATSIDELPQLFNVILGNMSLVGPRPHATATKSAGRLLEDVVEDYASRHRVKPGITGWAQCNGWRGETDTSEKIEKRVEHDLYYIENWSVFLDLLIIFKTLLIMLKKDENAY